MHLNAFNINIECLACEAKMMIYGAVNAVAVVVVVVVVVVDGGDAAVVVAGAVSCLLKVC